MRLGFKLMCLLEKTTGGGVKSAHGVPRGVSTVPCRADVGSSDGTTYLVSLLEIHAHDSKHCATTCFQWGQKGETTAQSIDRRYKKLLQNIPQGQRLENVLGPRCDPPVLDMGPGQRPDNVGTTSGQRSGGQDAIPRTWTWAPDNVRTT